MNHIRIDLFNDARDQFLELLDNEKINYSEVQLFSSGAALASNASIMISIVQASAPWIAFSTVAVAWLKTKSSRKIAITTKDQKTIHLEGLSAREVERILDRAERIAVIDTQYDVNRQVVLVAEEKR